MQSLLPHDLCHEWNASRQLPAEYVGDTPFQYILYHGAYFIVWGNNSHGGTAGKPVLS